LEHRRDLCCGYGLFNLGPFKIPLALLRLHLREEFLELLVGGVLLEPPPAEGRRLRQQVESKRGLGGPVVRLATRKCHASHGGLFTKSDKLEQERRNLEGARACGP
jgi:hypothetical protein